jgi:hypothetical protein
MKKLSKNKQETIYRRICFAPTVCWAGYLLERCNILIGSDLINRNHPDVLNHKVRMINSG